DVVPRAADEGVVAGAAGEPVVPVAAVDRQRDRVGCETRGVDEVVPAKRVDSEAVRRHLGTGHVDRRREAGHADGAGASRGLDDVALLSAFHDDAVGGVVAVAVGGGEVGGDGVDVGAGEVVDGDGVGAAEGVDVDGFDAVGVHGYGGDVAGESEAWAV